MFRNQILKETCTADNIIFKDEQHIAFYKDYLNKCKCLDTYHKSFGYCIGINKDARDHVDRIYDFKTGCVKPECLLEPWQTSGSQKVIRLAFNLYCDGIPSVCNYRTGEEQLDEIRKYTVSELFISSDVKFFCSAIRIRYASI